MRSFHFERGWRFLEVDVDLGSPMLDVSRTEPSDDMEDLEVCRLSEDDGKKSWPDPTWNCGVSCPT